MSEKNSEREANDVTYNMTRLLSDDTDTNVGNIIFFYVWGCNAQSGLANRRSGGNLATESSRHFVFFLCITEKEKKKKKMITMGFTSNVTHSSSQFYSCEMVVITLPTTRGTVTTKWPGRSICPSDWPISMRSS